MSFKSIDIEIKKLSKTSSYDNTDRFYVGMGQSHVGPVEACGTRLVSTDRGMTRVEVHYLALFAAPFLVQRYQKNRAFRVWVAQNEEKIWNESQSES